MFLLCILVALPIYDQNNKFCSILLSARRHFFLDFKAVWRVPTCPLWDVTVCMCVKCLSLLLASCA
jgi:hypothetical protein